MFLNSFGKAKNHSSGIKISLLLMEKCYKNKVDKGVKSFLRGSITSNPYGYLHNSGNVAPVRA